MKAKNLELPADDFAKQMADAVDSCNQMRSDFQILADCLLCVVDSNHLKSWDHGLDSIENVRDQIVSILEKNGYNKEYLIKLLQKVN